MFTKRQKKQDIQNIKGNKRFRQNIQTNLDGFLGNIKKINLEFEDNDKQNKNKTQKNIQISHLFKKPKIKNLKNYYKLNLSSFIEDDLKKQKDEFHIKEKKKFVKSEKKTIFEAKFIINQDNLYMPYEPYSYQSQSVFLLSKAVYSNKKAIMYESPTGTGKTQTILTTLLGYIKNKQVHKAKEHKILYFTRTVTQMNQVIDETKKSAYNVIATILSSRVSLCLNKDVNNQRNNNFQMINKCLDLQKTNSCPYKIDPIKPNKKFHIYNNVCDIEDLKEIGIGKSQCAYYFTKKMSDICDVVVLSYSYLVESIYRDSITNLVENNFIVFDEAHNIAKVLEQASSWELKFEDFQRILRELNFLMNTAELKRREGDVNNGVVNLCEKAIILITKIQKNFQNFIKNKKEEFYCGSYIIQLFSLDRITSKISFERLKDFIKQEKIKNILAKFLNIFQDMQNIFKKSKSDFKSFKLFINKKNEINYICLDAKIGFNNIMKLNPKQIILASGTLSPFDILEKQLGYSFDVKFSIEPDLESWYHSLAVMKIINFFDFHKNNSITFNYTSRSDKTLLTSFLKFLIFVSQIVPQGILIFLPSYKLLESYKNAIVANKELRRELENEKQIFFESKSPNVQIQFQQYQKACQNKGACFFLVFRGKYSEGLDFKNELARLVMIIGIPFGNVDDIKLKAKKEYLKELKQKNKKDKETLNYQDWYINEAFVQINQAAGRIKRNQKDFGLVFLVDSRYGHHKYKKFISNHLRKLEKDIQQKNKFKNFIKKFFEFNLPQKIVKKRAIKQQQKNIYTNLFQRCESQIEKEQNNQKRIKKSSSVEIKDFRCKFCNKESNNADEFQISNCDHLVCQNCFDKKETPKCTICKIYLKKNLIK